MSLCLIKRLMVVLAAFALLSGAMASPGRAIAAQTGVVAAMAGDDCQAMKMPLPCQACKSVPGKMTSSDCAKMMCCDSLAGSVVQFTGSVAILGSVSIAYDEMPSALQGRLAKPTLFPPKAV